jgi:hypothetical protein
MRILTTEKLVVLLIRHNALTVVEADAMKHEWEQSHRFRLMFESFEVAPNCRTLQMLDFAAKLSSGGVYYGREFESQEASCSSCVQ